MQHLPLYLGKYYRNENYLTAKNLQHSIIYKITAALVTFVMFLYRFREAIGLKVVTALRRNDFGVTHAAIDMVCALMHPMHDDYDLRQEQLNKSSLLQTKSFLENLLNMWTTHIVSY